MPELPEVETIKNQLIAKVKEKRISKLEILDPKVIDIDVSSFEKKVEGAVIIDIKRRAKLLVIELSNNQVILIHLKLTGQLIFESKDKKFDRAVFHFTDGTKLAFKDFRRLGFIKLIETNKLDGYLKQGKYGPEPLEKEFTLGVFKNLLKEKPKAKIKPLLMDQSFIAGIGNIYSDEALFFAKIHPLRKVATLTQKEIGNLYKGIREIIKKAISKKGSSIDSYVDIEGREGGFVPFLKVYRREGEKCYQCGGKVERIKIGGRSSYFCPKCQINQKLKNKKTKKH